MQLKCLGCAATYPVDQDGIPLLFCPTEGWNKDRDVTEVVKAFYEKNPFPNYDDLESRESLEHKASRGIFARLLNEQIPAGSLVLEVGCGTGQLTNFLGMSWKRQVFGSDVCLNSLRLAKGFRDRFSINNAAFLQMNLFRPGFRDSIFDVVISNGVLHHTGDPYRAFQSIAQLVKPGGIILIGLYNRIGRLTTDFRRFLFRMTHDHLKFLDGHMRNRQYNEPRKRAWFMDQYKHPHESKHGMGEVIEWFEACGFEYLITIPKIDGSLFTANERLFEPHCKGNRLSRFLTEVEMLLEGGVDGALFITIGRRVCEDTFVGQKPAEARDSAALKG
ncbi:MAG: class I SAM-dependent methyltransferase [Acidobacteria bacterium]|nr:class I SAM-dependent methyltransferase [Acidobacteriota bacterium]MCI0724023.1 class I SAM-dependent methyltransferase [Acidobacteriota bacterium]